MQRLLATFLALLLFASQASAGFLLNSFAVAPSAACTQVWGGSVVEDDVTPFSVSADIGTASADRVIVVAVHQTGGTGSKTMTGTVNGVALTNIQQGTGRFHFAYANVPSGSGSQTIAMTYSSDPTKSSVSWWIVTGCNTTHTDVQSTFSTTDTSKNIILTVPTGGIGIVAGTNGTVAAITTTNATENYDSVHSTGTGHQRIGARTTSTGAITVTFANINSMAGFAFGP